MQLRVPAVALALGTRKGPAEYVKDEAAGLREPEAGVAACVMGAASAAASISTWRGTDSEEGMGRYLFSPEDGKSEGFP